MTPPFDVSRYQDPLTIQRVLNGAKTIAVVGLSKNHLRASYFVAFYLRRHGYRVIPVDPRETEIFGEQSFCARRAGRCDVVRVGLEWMSNLFAQRFMHQRPARSASY